MKPLSEADESKRLAQLEARIEALKAPKENKPHTEEHYSQAHLAWRMVLELVVGLMMGFGIGYGLDYLLGTLPVFLIVFTLLGLAAGIKTMMRSAREIQHEKMAAEADRTTPATDRPGGQDEGKKNGG